MSISLRSSHHEHMTIHGHVTINISENKCKTRFDTLYNDLILNIFSNLDYIHLKKCRCLSKRLKKIAEDDYLWKNFARKMGSEETLGIVKWLRSVREPVLWTTEELVREVDRILNGIKQLNETVIACKSPPRVHKGEVIKQFKRMEIRFYGNRQNQEKVKNITIFFVAPLSGGDIHRLEDYIPQNLFWKDIGIFPSIRSRFWTPHAVMGVGNSSEEGTYQAIPINRVINLVVQHQNALIENACNQVRRLSCLLCIVLVVTAIVTPLVILKESHQL